MKNRKERVPFYFIGNSSARGGEEFAGEFSILKSPLFVLDRKK